MTAVGELCDRTSAVATEPLDDCLPPADGVEGESAVAEQAEPVEVYGDSAYGAGAVLSELDRAGVVAMVKVQAASAPQDRFTKDQLVIDLAVRTVMCPNGVSVSYRVKANGEVVPRFRTACSACPLRSQCTDSRKGRVVNLGPHEA